MEKLSLSLDDLRVDSFDTTPAGRTPKGTVFGEQCTCYTNCTCPGCPTCDGTCPNTCANCVSYQRTCGYHDECISHVNSCYNKTCTGDNPCVE